MIPLAPDLVRQIAQLRETFLVTVLCNDAATALVEISNGGDEADDSGVVLLIVGGSYDQARTADW